MTTMSLFTENLPAITTQAELDKVLATYPTYDPYYIASGCIPERRERFEKLFEMYKDHCDSHFLSQVKYHFHQRTWEMYVGCSLLSRGIKFTANDKGADFLIEDNGKKTWIECVACTEGEGDDRVPPMLYGTVNSVPESEMCIRIAGAIYDKYRDYQSFLGKSVSKDDAYIIAVNTGGFSFPPDGALPLILRCLFAIGHPTITFPRDGVGEATHGWSRVFSLKKKNGSDVPMDFFLKHEHAGISGAMYCSKNVLNHQEPIGSDILGISNLYANQPFPDFLKSAFLGFHYTLQDQTWSLTPQ